MGKYGERLNVTEERNEDGMLGMDTERTAGTNESENTNLDIEESASNLLGLQLTERELRLLRGMLPIANVPKGKGALETSVRRLRRPRAVVLLPSRELVVQTQLMAKRMSHIAKFRSLAVTHTTLKTMGRSLNMPIDLVIATPAALLTHVEQRALSLEATRYLVIDEADTLFARGFVDDTFEVIHRMRETAELRGDHAWQLVAVTATLPKTVNVMLARDFPRMVRVTTPSLHKVLPNIKHVFLEMSEYRFHKHNALLDVLARNDDESASIIVFCNTRASARAVTKFLESHNMPVVGLYGDIDDRTTKLEAFCERRDDAQILVSTDVASRGIDTTFVGHVVLFDFPTTVVDYIHRVGRTARAGRLGMVTSFVTATNRSFVDRIKESIRLKRVLN
jgi:superfamily II DNA/RNA helicase